ncbi:hypothetical protein [Streptomyces lydicamycinicus]|uniref:hypothetical protein n=1 Tax=Streptomyces lydicamycinicus TaxID=1546107 RepID=UPI003C2F6206
MMTHAKIGVALVGGYLLGRTKKAKMALGLGLFLAGKKLNLDPKQLGTLVANSPVLGPLNDQVRKELVDATKAAAGTALTQRMSGLADSLHERTLALDEGRDMSGETERTADDEEQAPEDGTRGDAEDAGGAADDEEKGAPSRKAPAAASAKTATKPSAASAKKSGSAARSTARRSSSSASGTSKSSGKNAGGASRGRPANSPARKTASGARKKASGAARTAADRGGRNG